MELNNSTPKFIPDLNGSVMLTCVCVKSNLTIDIATYKTKNQIMIIYCTKCSRYIRFTIEFYKSTFFLRCIEI